MRRLTKLMLAGTVCLAWITGSSMDVTDRHLSHPDSLAKSSPDAGDVNTSSHLSDSVARSAFTMTEEEYEQHVIAYHQEFKQAFDQLAEYRENTSNAIDSVWMSRQGLHLQHVYEVMEEYRSLQPPGTYQAVHEKYIEAMEQFEEGLMLYRHGYEQGNNKWIESSRAPLSKGEDLWNYAYSNILMTVEIPIGDGSLTNKQLRDMELLAGIDRNSVLLNISEDGRELSGRWGEPNEAGQIEPSLILYEEHYTEQYAKGEYSSRSNMTFGRWRYDYLTGILTVHVQSEYQDGKNKVKVGQDQMRYDVQRFKDDQLQLMNLDTLETYEYTREAGSWKESMFQ